MNKQPLTLLLAASMLGSTAILAQPSTATPSTEVNITCTTQDQVPTVVATNPTEDAQISILHFVPEYFTPEAALENCQNTAEKLQALYQSDNASYLVSDRLDSGSVVCAVERRGIGCDNYSAEVLFTLAHDDGNRVMYDLLGEDFKPSEPPVTRTMGRIYTDLGHEGQNTWWWPF